MRPTAVLTLCIALALSTLPAMADKAVCPVTADVGVSSVVEKMGFSNGRGPTTSIMQNQNWSGFENMDLLMAFDTKAVKGWTVSSATMHLTLAKGDLYGIGLCTVLSEWSEGDALNWVASPGAPCWNYRSTPPEGAKAGPEHSWAWPGSLLHSVCWSHPAARYSHAGNAAIKRTKTEDGRFVKLSFPVDPKLVEALAAGLAHGLVLTDDKGQVRESYSLIGPAYPYLYNAADDIWVFTRDISVEALRPYLEVVGEPTDTALPGAPTDLKVAEVSAGDGVVVVTFTAPGDDGNAGEVLAYEVAADGKPLPRWALPAPVSAGKTQRLPVFTLAAGKHELAIRGVDEAGNRGPAGTLTITVPPPPPAKLAELPKAGLFAAEPASSELKYAASGPLAVAAVSDMVKVDPVSGAVLTDGEKPGRLLPPGEGDLWNARGQKVALTAAANEVVAFQLLCRAEKGKLANVSVSVGDLTGKGGKIAAQNVSLHRLWYVATVSEKTRAVGPGEMDELETAASGYVGTACVPMRKPYGETFDVPSAKNPVAGQTNQAVWIDVYVPRGTPAGEYSGTVAVSADGLRQPMKLALLVNVLPVALPEKPTFVVEMNRYHSPVGWAGASWNDPAAARKAAWDYYALAHRHRLVLNVLPYSHSARTDAEYLPKMAGEGVATRIAGWDEWDKLFGPLLDGSAFSAEGGYIGPGAGVPIDHMQLAFHEGWPIPINKDTYADWKECVTREDFAEYAKAARRPHEAFTDAYQKGHVEVARQFFAHMGEKSYTRTQFQFFNNNKYYWKVAYFGGMGRGGVSFWLMDEPSDFDDYDANAFIMSLGKEGWRAAKAPQVQAAGRTDVSQPDMARGLWDGPADLWVIGGFRGFWPTAAVRRLWLPDQHYWGYGGGIGVQMAPVQLGQSFLQRYATGMTGFMPWWNCFGDRGGSWSKPDSLSIYYCGATFPGGGAPEAVATVRMKLTRRGQQDVEYLNLLAAKAGWDRTCVRRALARFADDPDASVLTFSKLTLKDYQDLRRQVAETILKAKDK